MELHEASRALEHDRSFEQQLREAEPIAADEAATVVRVASDEAPELAVMSLLERLEAGSPGAS